MASKAATLGDPRRPGEVRLKGAVAAASPDDSISQIMFLVATTCGVSGMMFQSKILVWAGLFATMAGFTHMPFDAHDGLRMLMMSFTMLAWAFAQVYFRHYLVGSAPRPAPAAAKPSVTLEDD